MEEEKVAEEVNDEVVVVVVDVLLRDGIEVCRWRILTFAVMNTDYFMKTMTIRANTGAHSVTSVRISSQNCAENSQPLRNRYVPSPHRLPEAGFDVILT